MAQTKKGKELERFFKNQETPEESKRKITKGFAKVKTQEDNIPQEEFIARPFKEIYDETLTASKTHLQKEVRFRLAGYTRNIIHGMFQKQHCNRNRILIHVYSRENEREVWYHHLAKISMCPCCGDTYEVGNNWW